MYKYLGTPKKQSRPSNEGASEGNWNINERRASEWKKKKLICGTTNNKILDLCELCLYVRHNAISTDLFTLFFFGFIDKIHNSHSIREGFFLWYSNWICTYFYARTTKKKEKKERWTNEEEDKSQLIKPPEWMISITACFRLSDGRSRQFFEIMIQLVLQS